MAETAAQTASGGNGRGRGGGGRRKRAGVGIADQLLYSLTNFALTVLVARSVTTTQFGAYSLIIATYLIALAVIRGLTSETLVVRLSAADPKDWRRGAIAGAAASAVLGLAGLVGLVGFGLFAPQSLASTSVTLGIVFPALVLQDYLRFAALSAGRPALALVNDGVQAVVQFGGTGLMLGLGHHSPAVFVGAWGVGAVAGAAAGVVLLRLPVRLGRAGTWFREHGSFGGRYALDDLAQQSSQQATTYAVAATAGLVDTGALRGAQTVFGPPSILNLGIQAAVTPELVRIGKRSLAKLRRYALLVGAAMGSVGAVWCVLALLCPRGLGEALFGDTWAPARPLLIFFGIAQAANGLRVGAMAGLRALSAANRTLVARSFVLTLGLSFQVVGAIVDGAHGVAIAIAIVSPLQAIVWWWQFLVALGDAKGTGGRHRPGKQAELVEQKSDVSDFEQTT